MLTNITNSNSNYFPSPAYRTANSQAEGALTSAGQTVGEALGGREQGTEKKGDSAEISNEANEPKCECCEDRVGNIGKALGGWLAEQNQNEGGQSQNGGQDERSGTGPLFPNNPNRPVGVGPWPSFPLTGPSMPRRELPRFEGPSMPGVPFDPSWMWNAAGAR